MTHLSIQYSVLIGRVESMALQGPYGCADMVRLWVCVHAPIHAHVHTHFFFFFQDKERFILLIN